MEKQRDNGTLYVEIIKGSDDIRCSYINSEGDVSNVFFSEDEDIREELKKQAISKKKSEQNLTRVEKNIIITYSLNTLRKLSKKIDERDQISQDICDLLKKKGKYHYNPKNLSEILEQ